jgi:hypothetical protein
MVLGRTRTRMQRNKTAVMARHRRRRRPGGHTTAVGSGGRRAPFSTDCLDPRRHGSARTCSLHCTLTPAACAARSARSAPGRDTQSGQGALARRHTDGPLWEALLKTTVMCKAWRRCTTLLGILLELLQLLSTSASPRDKSLIPIPVPVQYRLSLCLE